MLRRAAGVVGGVLVVVVAPAVALAGLTEVFVWVVTAGAVLVVGFVAGSLAVDQARRGEDG
jgi:hypothetical protein